MIREEWLEERRKSIGSSDSSAIMGCGFSTPYQIWLSKVHGVDQPDNPAMARGRDLEPVARARFELLTGHFVFPERAVHKDIPWMTANLDGFNETGIVCEIKCPMSHAPHVDAINGDIPDYYMPQLQHQMHCLRSHNPHFESMFYVSFHPDFPEEQQLVFLEVGYDEEYCKELVKKEADFWEHVVTKTAPPLTDRDYQMRHDEEWKDFEERWRKETGLLKIVEEKIERLKEERDRLTQGKNSRGELLKVTYYLKPGSVDYCAVPELKGIDLEQYRKPSVQQCRVSVK